MLKKIAIPILTSVLVLSACGNEGEPGNGGESGAATGEDTVELDVTWRYAGDPDNIGSYVNDFKEYYEEQQDTAIINPASVTASEGDYFSNVSLSLQSADTAPEILSQDTFMISSDANAGYLVNLDDRVEEWDEWDNFIGNVTEGVLGEDGSVYGIPTTTDSRGIWYNKNVFEEAGLDQEWQPTTWDEILEAGETIRDNTDAVPFAMNVASVNGEAVTMQTFQMFLYGTGETMYDEENEQWNVNGEGILDSLTFIDEVMNQRNLGPSLSIAINQNYGSVMLQDMLPAGEAGMVLDGSWNMANYVEGGIAEFENPEEELGFAMMPTQDGGGDGFMTMAGGWSWAIPTNSEHHEESWEAIKEMSTQEWQTHRAMTEGTLTVREDSAEEEEYINRPFVDTATEALNNAYFRPKHDLYPNISIFVQNAVEAVATGEMTPEEAAEQYRTEVIDLVGEENTY
jgi:multiple sugar transport system substrate-binding protein